VRGCDITLNGTLSQVRSTFVPVAMFDEGSAALYIVKALGGTVERPIRGSKHFRVVAINKNQDALAVAFRIVPVPFVGHFKHLTSRFAREHGRRGGRKQECTVVHLAKKKQQPWNRGLQHQDNLLPKVKRLHGCPPRAQC
jgi:hypothetical protein